MQKFTRTSQVSSGRRTLLQCIPASVLGLLSSSVLAAWGAEAADKAYPQRMAVSDTPQLASVSNFRDLAGASDAKAYQTVEGLWLQRGVIYRSNEMRPLPQDQAALAALGVSWVHDLRTPGEIARKPDLLPHGAQYVQNNILGLKNIDIEDFRVASSQEAESLMIRGIQDNVNSEPIRKQFSLLLQSLASNAGAQVFHCSAGKDRTGWAAAVLLLVLGVPESVVIQDYALSNTYLQASMEKQHAALVKLYGQKLADALVPTLGVSPVFMEAGLQAMKAKYGDVNGYVTQGLALSPADVQALKGRLLRT